MARNLDLSVILKGVDKVTGPLKNVTQGSTKTAKAIKASKDELSGLKSAQRNLKSFSNLREKSSEASQALSEEQERVAELTRAIEQSDKPSKRMNERRDAAIRKAQRLKRKVNEHTEALEKSRREMRSSDRITRGLVNQMTRGGDTAHAMARAEKQLQRQMDRTNKTIERQQDRLKRLGKLKQKSISARISGGNFAQSAGAAGRRAGLAGSLVGGAIAFGGHSFAKRTENTRQWAARLGVAADELSRLQYAGQQYGVQQQAMIDGLKELSLRADEFATTGKGQSAGAFERLGFSQRAIDDAKANTSELFNTVMSRLRQVKDVAARQRIVDEIFGGTAGEQLTEMATATRKEILRLKREADAMGVTLSKEDIKAAREYTESLYGAQGALRGVHHTLGRVLAPVLTDVLESLKAWIADNRDAVREFAKELGGNLKAAVPVLVKLASGAAAFAGTLATATLWAARLVGGMDNLAMIAGTLFAGKTLLSAFAFLKTLWGLGSAALAFVTASGSIIGALKAIGIALAANPIGIVVSLIAAAATYIIANWGQVKPFFVAIWEDIKGAFSGTWDFIKDLFSWSPLGMLMKNWKPIMDFFKGLWDMVGGLWDQLFGDDKGGAKEKMKNAGRAAHRFAGAAAVGASTAGAPAMAAADVPAAVGASTAGAPAMAAADVPIDRTPRVQAERPAEQGMSIGPIHITVNPSPGMDEQAIARKVREEIENLEREQSARRNSRLHDEE